MGFRGAFPIACAVLAAFLLPSAASPRDYGQATGLREIGVKLLADEEYRAVPDWRARAESRLRAAASEFENAFGLRFAVRAAGAWISEPSLHSLEDIGRIVDARVDKEGCEVLLVFTGQEGLAPGSAGFALFKEGLVVVLDRPQSPLGTRTLQHELGHLFGAVHLPDPDSVMDYFVQGRRFDERNAEVIRLCRERTFNTVDFPLPRRHLEALAAIYESIGASVLAALDAGDDRGRTAAAVRGTAGPDGRPDLFHLDDPFLMLAQVRLEQGLFDETLAACRSALSINPDNLDTLNMIGIARRRKGRIEDAVDIYGEILRRKPEQPKVLYNLGIALSKRGDAAGAKSAYEQALSLKPNFAEARNNLGELALRDGKTAEAADAFLKALDDAPGFALARANLAEALLLGGHREGALAEVRTALALNPELPSAHNVLGNILRDQGRTEEAIAAYRRAIALSPRDARVHFNLGISLFDLDRVEDAAAQFRKALELDPRFAEARASLGYCLLHDRRPDEGILEIRKAQEMGFRSAKTYLNLSFAFLEKQMPAQAVAEARRALAVDPRLALAHNNLGIAYHRLGRTEDAFREIAAAVALDPDGKDALWNLGNLHFETGRFDRALELYLRLERFDSGNGALLNNIAVASFRLKSYGSARAYAKKAEAAGFTVHPDFLAALKKALEKD